MSQVDQARATRDDLYRISGKAELIGGRIVHIMPTGYKPNRVAGRIYRSLDDYAEHVGRGVALTDNIGFTISVLPSGRESFAPDAAYHIGPLPTNPMRFIEGPPVFAAEVRSENDYGDVAELRLSKKRADYFEAGTQVVWDVDPVAECIHVYRAPNPATAVTYRRGEQANAEPAVPGWTVSVDWIFG